MNLDEIALGCICTLRVAASKVVASPDHPLKKMDAMRAISKALGPFNYVKKTCPSEAAVAFRETSDLIGTILLQMEQAIRVPVMYEKVSRTRQHGTVFGGMQVKTLY